MPRGKKPSSNSRKRRVLQELTDQNEQVCRTQLVHPSRKGVQTSVKGANKLHQDKINIVDLYDEPCQSPEAKSCCHDPPRDLQSCCFIDIAELDLLTNELVDLPSPHLKEWENLLFEDESREEAEEEERPNPCVGVVNVDFSNCIDDHVVPKGGIQSRPASPEDTKNIYETTYNRNELCDIILG